MNWLEKDPSSINPDIHPCAVCIHVPHLDLVDIGQDMSTTVRLMGTPNPMKKISNRLTLRPQNPYTPEMCPVSIPVKFFSFWHYMPIDNHWTDHSYQFWPPNPYMRLAAAHERQVICSWFPRKQLIAKLLERFLLVATGVPYKSKLTFDSCHRPFKPKTDDLCFGPKRATYSSGHNSDSGQHGIFLKFSLNQVR